MKCPYCGAMNQDNICEFCDSELSKEQTTIPISNHFYGYTMEQSSNTKSFNSTIDKVNKKETPLWVWILGWICIFPLPLTILFLRKKDRTPALKYSMIVFVWILYFLIGFSSDTETIPQQPEPPYAFLSQLVVQCCFVCYNQSMMWN